MKTDKNLNTEAVPTHIWNNIEQELDKKNKKTIIWWRLAGVLVLAITSFGVARYLMDGTTKTNELAIVKPIEKIKPITLNQETLIDSIKDNYELEEEVEEINNKNLRSDFIVKSYPIDTAIFNTSSNIVYSITDASTANYAFVATTQSPPKNTGKGLASSSSNGTFRNIHSNINELGYRSVSFYDEKKGGYLAIDKDGKISTENYNSPSINNDYKSDNYYINGEEFFIKNEFYEDNNTSTFEEYIENEFKSPKNEPLSTLSVDVDKASLPTFRSYVENGTRAPKDAVRIEEFINYFNYDYAAPTGDKPVTIHTEYSASPWNKKGMLLKVGLKGKEVTRDDSKHSNLVFLIDVSGSMSDEDKLPLLEQSLNLLVDQLEEEDYISIVTYAGSAGLVLPAISGMYKDKIKQAIDGLAAGGSTAGADGITLAYEQAQLNYRAGHNNRVILATDGDFNVGTSSDKGLEDLIVEKRETGIELSVLGFGDGNFQSSKMENLAQNGNGNFSYLDNLKEAKKVLVEEMSGTLQTIAKDVKLQVEFNPLVVGAYRLIGYENRILAHQDFNNDKVDASDMGAGHTITAVYEIIPVSLMDDGIRENLKYQKVETTTLIGDTNELATISMRYKEPGGDVSKKVQHIALNKVENASVDFTFIKGVIGFCQLYKRSKYRGDLSLQHIVDLLKDGKGKDKQGYRKSFINLIKDVKFE